MNRHGFALLAVLWLTVTVAGIVGRAMGVSHRFLGAAQNRVDFERERWAAEGCAAEAIADLDRQASKRADLNPTDRKRIDYADGLACFVEILAPQARLRRDTVSGDALAVLDSIAAAVTGIALESLVTQDGDGRIDINHAAWPVLATLPGWDGESARQIVALRDRWRRFESLADALEAMPASRRALVQARYSELERRIVFSPSQLVIHATGVARGSRVRFAIELLVADAGGRIAVLRRRTE